MNSISQIFGFDTQLFLWINQDLANPVFDFIMPWIRNKYFWIWLYALILIVAFKNDKKAWVLLIMAGITILLCDGVSAGLIKSWVGRLRPCNDPSLSSQVHLLVPCGSGFSFVSAHAANHFGLAFVFSGYFSKWFNPKWVYTLFILWATCIAFAQVYVGVHYPMDVICGALLGGLIGSWIWKISRFALNKQKA